MLDHDCLINIIATAARGSVFVSTVILYSMAYDVTDVTNDNNFAPALSARASAVLIDMVRKPSVKQKS